ncbi:MAG: hypothetical protein WBC04_24185, partial [Candidatus Acidiferrales bacterium]
RTTSAEEKADLHIERRGVSGQAKQDPKSLDGVDVVRDGSGDQRKTLNLLSFQGSSLTELHLQWPVLFSHCSRAIFLVSSP